MENSQELTFTFWQLLATQQFYLLLAVLTVLTISTLYFTISGVKYTQAIWFGLLPITGFVVISALTGAIALGLDSVMFPLLLLLVLASICLGISTRNNRYNALRNQNEDTERRYKEVPLNFSQVLQTGLIFWFAVAIMGVLQCLHLYNFDTHFYNTPTNDELYYAKQSVLMLLEAKEVTGTHLENWHLGIPASSALPYHYPELWFSTLLRLFTDTSGIYSFVLLTIPVLIGVAVSSLVSIAKLSGLTNTKAAICALFIAFGSVGLLNFLTLGWVYSALTGFSSSPTPDATLTYLSDLNLLYFYAPKLALTLSMVAMMLVFAYTNKIAECLFAATVLLYCSVAPAPAVLAGVGLLWVFSCLQSRKFAIKALALPILGVLAFGGFYYWQFSLYTPLGTSTTSATGASFALALPDNLMVKAVQLLLFIYSAAMLHLGYLSLLGNVARPQRLWAWLGTALLVTAVILHLGGYFSGAIYIAALCGIVGFILLLPTPLRLGKPHARLFIVAFGIVLTGAFCRLMFTFADGFQLNDLTMMALLFVLGVWLTATIMAEIKNSIRFGLLLVLMLAITTTSVWAKYYWESQITSALDANALPTVTSLAKKHNVKTGMCFTNMAGQQYLSFMQNVADLQLTIPDIVYTVGSVDQLYTTNAPEAGTIASSNMRQIPLVQFLDGLPLAAPLLITTTNQADANAKKLALLNHIRAAFIKGHHINLLVLDKDYNQLFGHKWAQHAISDSVVSTTKTWYFINPSKL